MTQPRIISRCKIKPTKNDPNGSGMLAYASILIDSSFYPVLGEGVWIHDFEIYRTDGRLRVSAPRRYDEFNRTWRFLTFEDKRLQDGFEQYVLAEYKRCMERFHS